MFEKVSGDTTVGEGLDTSLKLETEHISTETSDGTNAPSLHLYSVMKGM